MKKDLQIEREWVENRYVNEKTQIGLLRCLFWSVQECFAGFSRYASWALDRLAFDLRLNVHYLAHAVSLLKNETGFKSADSLLSILNILFRFSRHNVLHLWPYVITDLKNLGAKAFYGKFATGQIEHISASLSNNALLASSFFPRHSTVAMHSLEDCSLAGSWNLSECHLYRCDWTDFSAARYRRRWSRAEQQVSLSLYW